MKLTERLELFARAVAICPEIKYELGGMKRFYIEKTEFGEGFMGEEINIRRTTGEMMKYAPYVESINIEGIEFFTYLHDEDIDEDAKEFI